MDIQTLKQDIKAGYTLGLADALILREALARLEKAEVQLAELSKQENNDSLAIKESHFLSDVMTAAGLVAHGKRDKALAERLSAYCVYRRNTTAPPSPVKLPDMQKIYSIYCTPTTGSMNALAHIEGELLRLNSGSVADE